MAKGLPRGGVALASPHPPLRQRHPHSAAAAAQASDRGIAARFALRASSRARIQTQLCLAPGLALVHQAIQPHKVPWDPQGDRLSREAEEALEIG